MTTYRTERRSRYTNISMNIMDDQELSADALGVLVYLLSRPDDWKTKTSQLCQRFNCGKDKMQRILREIEAAGYMRRYKIRNDDGTFLCMADVFESPVQAHPEPGYPEPGFPALDNPAVLTNTELPITDSPKKERKIQKERKAETPDTLPGIEAGGSAKEAAERASPSKTECDFEVFWRAYPRRVGRGAALKAFARALKAASLEDLLAGIQRYIKTKPDWQDYCHPATWLNQQRWLDDVGASERAEVPMATKRQWGREYLEKQGIIHVS